VVLLELDELVELVLEDLLVLEDVVELVVPGGVENDVK
jgi:hypothetical protein